MRYDCDGSWEGRYECPCHRTIRPSYQSIPEPVPLCTTLIPHLTILYRNLADPAPYPTPLCRVAAQAGVGCRTTCTSKVKDKIKLSPTVLVLPNRINPTPCETPSALTSNCSQQRIMYHIVYHHSSPCIRTIYHAKHIHRLSATPWHQCTRCSVLPLRRCAVPWLRTKHTTAHGIGRIFNGDVL